MSCQRIADHLNALGVPPAYVRDHRTVRRGKRSEATQGIWRAGRVRNTLVSTTYKGVHLYGKRDSVNRREVIERSVPALVTEEMWDQAQTTLRHNRMLSSPIAKHRYLLRGLIRCGCCGLTYCGATWSVAKGTQKRFYTCNGRGQARGIYGARGEKCPSKAISGVIEEVVWNDVEEFLRNPGAVLELLRHRLAIHTRDAVDINEETSKLEHALRRKQVEKDAVIAIFRRGRIDAESLDRQLDEIDREEAVLREERHRLQAKVEATSTASDVLGGVEDLLRRLSSLLDGSITWEIKRQLIEALVNSVTVETEELQRPTSSTRADTLSICAADLSVNDRRDTGSSPRPA